jgi:hypothetical protein
MTAKPPDKPEPSPKRGPGRPRTGNAVPNKDRQDAHRKRLAEAGHVRLELKVSAAVRDQLDELQVMTGLDRDKAAELAISEKHRRLAGVSTIKKGSRRRA